MLIVSLVLNLLVLIPVCVGLLTRAGWTTAAFGEWTPARGILLAVYLAIGIASGFLLAVPEAGSAKALLAVQVVYKVSTPFTVGTLRNPVVVSNLAIAAVHLITVITA